MRIERMESVSMRVSGGVEGYKHKSEHMKEAYAEQTHVLNLPQEFRCQIIACFRSQAAALGKLRSDGLESYW